MEPLVSIWKFKSINISDHTVLSSYNSIPLFTECIKTAKITEYLFRGELLPFGQIMGPIPNWVNLKIGREI